MIRKTIQGFKQNLSIKLISLFVIGGIVLSMLIGGLTEFGFERHFVSQIRPHFFHYIEQIHQDIGTPANIEKAKEITESRPIIIRIFSDELTWASDGVTRRPHRIRRHDKFQNRKGSNESKPLRPFIKHPRGRGLFFDQGTIFILKTNNQQQVFYGFKVRPGKLAWFPVSAALLVLLALYAFYRLTRRLFSPLKEIQQGVRLIGEGKLGHQIKVNRTDELGELANRVNKMSLDLSQMMQAKRDMLLALSHELKSPLARSRVSLALLDKSDLQQNLLNDQQQIERLIDEVLATERGYADHALLHREATDLIALANTVIKDDLNAYDKIELTHSGDLSALLIDENQIRRLLRNLLDNALAYQRATEGSEKNTIQLTLQASEDYLIIEVKDHGVGIATEHIHRLTEAFYRADPARAKNTGGLGLGLYLCKVIAEAHGGEINIESEMGVGTVVTVRIALV